MAQVTVESKTETCGTACSESCGGCRIFDTANLQLVFLFSFLTPMLRQILSHIVDSCQSLYDGFSWTESRYFVEIMRDYDV